MKILSEFYPVKDYSSLPISQYANYLTSLALDITCGKIDSNDIKYKSIIYDYGIIFNGSYAKGRLFFKRGESGNTNQDLSYWECVFTPYYDDEKLVKIEGEGLDDFKKQFRKTLGITSSRYFTNTDWVTL